MITSPAWKDKKYAVLGLARSGRATVEALLAAGANVLVWDDRAEAREPFAGRCAIGDPLEADLTGYAGVVVSPGVPLNTHPIKPHADSFGVPVIGDIELFAQARANLPPHKVVGITGTNGKSTTTALVHHILKTAGVPTTMGGNIGLPILEQEPLPAGGVYVLELSSYQIDLTYSLDCYIAVLLNVTPDHLDRYDGDFEKYVAAKIRLFEMQEADGLKLIGTSDAASSAAYERFFESAQPVTRQEYPDQPDWPSLQGPHNRENVSAAILTAFWFDIPESSLDQALRTFPGLPHRMQRVAEISGVAYVNDSKGTNTAASAPALAAFDNIHWILGGLAKEPGLGECEAELPHVKAAYTIGKAGPQFATLLEGRVPVEQCETLDRAVASAAAKAEAGDTVLLSPACASFDQYADFEKRGDHFRELVEGLK
ncbi:UDP-N-acetylmuramoyl-L-alanine--D-glutamate ligase [Qipengyuania psychrotolerans]|uniref:UDP-N-acetylmuramoylalanine--D-glutamate ligase n=1 Tax=Qipengyuania psychrotolerans TaxID=2867238 RepID=A0ABX8ZBN5_9SPHN|nr:UDP-N-acetylmuramoyl-L-alanine--D-glutamate ligase [Qipengyuania psychrotolerans]QZD86387.1 UDP-N-acetylmuramoyl-L-alanine--D-glutamate ligase [Qipengyuania psychrotolerans]